MPLVGIDWSQTGVTHLFSAVKVCYPKYFVCSIFINDNSVEATRQKQRFISLPNISTGKWISVDILKCTSDISGLSHKTISS